METAVNILRFLSWLYIVVRTGQRGLLYVARRLEMCRRIL